MILVIVRNVHTMKTEYLNIITIRENQEREDTIDSFLEFLMDISSTNSVHRLSITKVRKGNALWSATYHLNFTIRLWGTSQYIQYNYIFNRESENFSKNFAAIAVAYGNCPEDKMSDSVSIFLRMEEEE